MAGEAKSGQKEHLPQSEVGQLRQEFNKLVDDMERIRAALARGFGVLLSDPGLAIGTASAAEVAHDEFTAALRGEEITVSAAEVAFTADTHDIADPDADPREAYFTLSVDDAGAVTITKGDDAAADAAVKPAAPADEVVIGWVLIQHDGTAPFDATTDDLDAAHLTVTFEDAEAMAADDLTGGKVNP